MELITAARGSAHITPLQDSLWHRAFCGQQSCVFAEGEKFEPQVMNNALIRIKDGIGMIQGRFFCIEPNSYDEITMDNGQQGVNRIDIICAKITVNTDGTQNGGWQIIQGEPSTGEPVAPEYIEGDLDGGDLQALYGMVQVKFEGTSITEVTSIATKMIDDCSMTEAEYDELAALLGITE